MADNQKHHKNNLRVVSANPSVLPASSAATSVTSLLSSNHDSSTINNCNLAIGQADNIGQVMIPLNAGELDLLRASNITFSTSSLSSTSHSNSSNTTSTPNMGTNGNASSTIFTSSASSSASGFVLNGVVDESGNVLFEAVESDMINQNNFLQPHLQPHQQQQQQQQPDHVAGIHSSSTSSEIGSSGVIDPQSLNLLHLHSDNCTLQSNNATNVGGSNMSFADTNCNVSTSSAAGLIQAISTINRGGSNTVSLSGLLPITAVQRESTAVDQGLAAFNSASRGNSIQAANAPEIFLAQQQQELKNQMLLSRVADIMEGSGMHGGSIISNTPSVNLHHGKRDVTPSNRHGMHQKGAAAPSSNNINAALSDFGQSSVVTISLNQQLQEQLDETRQQQQQQLLWTQPGQSRVPATQDSEALGNLNTTLGGAAASSSLLPSASQQGKQVPGASSTFLLLPQQAGSSGNSTNGTFQDVRSQFAGIFNSQAQQETYQMTASSSSSNFGHVSSEEQPHPYAVIGGDSEATPSYPGNSQQHQQQQQQQQVVVESQAVDSSCLQQEYTLVFDAGSQVICFQRVASPSDCTVSQSVVGMEGSEAQPTPAQVFIPSSSQAYSQTQGSHLHASLACGISSEEVTTSSMPPQLRAGPSGVHPHYGNRSSEAISRNSSSSRGMKLEKSDVDGAPECDTTQEGIEHYDHESPTYVDTSNNIDDDEAGLDSTATRRVDAGPMVEGIIDTALHSSGLTALQAVAMETSSGILQTGSAADESINAQSSSGGQASQPHQLADFLTDDVSPSVTPVTQSVRKSRRLELVAQEARASLKKRDYKSKLYDPALLWCEDCMEAYSDQCPVHRLTAVPDKIVLSRAWASCPNQAQICRLPEAQLAPEESPVGVFAKRQIPKFTQFGPFLGVLVATLDEVTRQYFPLMLDLPNKPRQYFETADENQCNWMMFVRPAQTFAEQNLVAYQHKRNVFFSSTKVIEPKQELKVWYAAHYAEQMGVKTLELTQDDIQALDEADGKFACSECSRRFKSWAALQLHLSTHDEEDLEEAASDAKDALLLEYGNAEADGDADFVPGNDGDESGQLSSQASAAAQKKTRNAFLRGRLRQSRSRGGLGDGARKKSTFLAKTLKKYKRSQNTRPGADKVPQTMKGMYHRRGNLSGGNEWMCTHCGLTFDNASLLNLHTLTHAAEDVGMDEIRKLAAPQAMESTSDTPTNQSLAPSNSSPNGTTETFDLNPQASGEIEGEDKSILSVACPKCNVVFKDHKDLMDHVSTHAQKPLVKDGRPFCCSQCPKSFSTSERLARHQLVHGDDSEKPLECPVCFKRITNNSAMACHMKKHSDRKYYDCPICGTDFDTASGMREHAQVRHADPNGRYPCLECPKIFDDFGLLKKHVRSFHSSKVFPCPECNKKFPREDKLRLHMLRHTTHREFMCETCGRQFKRKDKLKEHMKRLHCRERMEQIGASLGGKQGNTGVAKPTSTKFTPRIYKSSSKRKVHIQKVHPGCAVPPSARKKASLSSLLTIDTDAAAAAGAASGGAPVVGGFNSNSFSHTVSSITTMPHGCKFCHKQYASKAKLLQHQRKQHPEVAEPRLSSRRKIKKTEPDVLQIAVGGDERYESVLPITVVNQGGDSTSLQATDLLNLAMSELSYNGGVASLSSLISSLGAGAATANPVGGGAMVHIQSSTGQLQPATIDLSQLSQLNQALQTFSVAGQGTGAGVATVLQTPLSPSQHQHHHQQQQQQQQQQLLQQHQQQQQQLQHQQQQQLMVVTSNGSQPVSLGMGGQFIARAWPANFTAQQFR
ncbi:PR domain Zinc finger protein 10-like [Plakobranchus ocellatus]|uniref:PR domain Zinc finger protein 10-like n=1 Tax=Plakobranchus ocellatus TaxID=259542 RepID=A0AAV4CP79_9GAST|nr:PR domain Zinc finger protein 10-like [Plakobranchus ocellatus]